jgi:adenylate kinase family enzyme
MARTLLIMGESGAGKTTSARTLDPKTTLYIDCDRKGLSFKGWKKLTV